MFFSFVRLKFLTKICFRNHFKSKCLAINSLPNTILCDNEYFSPLIARYNYVSCCYLHHTHLFHLNHTAYKIQHEKSFFTSNCIDKYGCIDQFNKRYYSDKKLDEEAKNLSIFQRFKVMYKQYWYVLVPVHIATSTIWISSFYYLAKSGVDIVSLLESLGVAETFIDKLRNGHSTTGYLAIAGALYKLATPLRYTVTLGGTTISIKYLKEWGYIKPIPPKDKLKEMYHEKKDMLIEKKENFKDIYKKKRQALKVNKNSSLNKLLRNLHLKKKFKKRRSKESK